MRNRKKGSSKLIGSVICTFLLLLCACVPSNPVTVDDAESFLTDHLEELQTVADYCIDSGIHLLLIRSAREAAEYDLPDSCKDAVRELRRNGVRIIGYLDTEACIEFELWNSVQDIGCGIAYSFVDGAEPDIQFLTEIQPLSVENWYYYVTDYNTWRAMQEE